MEIHVCLSYVGHLELTRHHLPEVLALLSLLLTPIKKKKKTLFVCLHMAQMLMDTGVV